MKHSIYNWCLSLLMLSTIGSFLACSDDDEVSYGPFSVDKTEVKLTNNLAATERIVITSPADWKINSDVAWLTMDAGMEAYGTSGNGINLNLYVTENTNEAARMATLTLVNLSDKSKLTVKISQPGHTPQSYTDTNSSAPAGMQSNATKLIKEMKTGINLGNTMESNSADETSWGNPTTTKAMIDALNAQGFNTIRIPVRWAPRADEDMNIDAMAMARVKEVVDYAYSQGMYVILNSHHDSWYDRVVPGTLSETKTDIIAKFNKMWTQIATTFKDYDEHLLFAGTNEVIYISQGKEVWDEPTNEDLFVYMKDLNQTFIDAVRATSGNNAWRTLIVQPWSANPTFALKHFVKPIDTVENRMLLEFHYYQPYNFCQQQGDDTKGENMYFWGAPYADYRYAVSTVNVDGVNMSAEAAITKMFADLKYKFVDQGMPVIMGEYGAVKHEKTSGNSTFGLNFTKSEESRAYYLQYVVKEAKNHGFPALFWDNNCIGTTGENFGLFDRNNGMTPYSQSAVDAILKGASEGVYPF